MMTQLSFQIIGDQKRKSSKIRGSRSVCISTVETLFWRLPFILAENPTCSAILIKQLNSLAKEGEDG